MRWMYIPVFPDGRARVPACDHQPGRRCATNGPPPYPTLDQGVGFHWGTRRMRQHGWPWGPEDPTAPGHRFRFHRNRLCGAHSGHRGIPGEGCLQGSLCRDSTGTAPFACSGDRRNEPQWSGCRATRRTWGHPRRTARFRRRGGCIARAARWK